jgi:HSP20 family protein
MALIRWQPFQELETLHRQMDRMLDEMTGASSEYRVTWKPAIELQDKGKNVILRAEIPGVEGKDLDVRVTREAVAISGEHRYEEKAEENGMFGSEFRYGKFERVIPLPVAVQNDRVNADFTNGILTLTLPKLAADRAVKVNVVNVSEPVAQMEASSEQPVETETDDLWESQSTESAAA